jgi:hypothetical protein
MDTSGSGKTNASLGRVVCHFDDCDGYLCKATINADCLFLYFHMFVIHILHEGYSRAKKLEFEVNAPLYIYTLYHL